MIPQIHILVLLAWSALGSADSVLNLTASSSGQISIWLNGRPWLSGGDRPPYLRIGMRTQSLRLAASEAISGQSAGLGEYMGTAWEWLCPDTGGGATCLRTELRRYTELANSVEIVHIFPAGVENISSAPSDALVSGWPALEDISGISASTSKESRLTWQTLNGYFATSVDRGRGLDCIIGTQGGTPLILHDDLLPSTLVVSPMSRPKTGHLSCLGQVLTLGLKPTLTAIPAGFSASWILHAGASGVTDAVLGWGSVLLKNAGKKRVRPYEDEVTSTIGYWTDNGAYFHYPTDGPTTKAGGYWDEILKADAAFKETSFPFRHWQLDSWWYEKGHGGNGSSRGQGDIGPYLGVYRWEADPFVFPPEEPCERSGGAQCVGGLPGVQAHINLPFVLHNRWFHPGNWYIKQGIPSTGWTPASVDALDRLYEKMGTDSIHQLKAGISVALPPQVATLPYDSFAFFDYLLNRSKNLGFGLHTYEQDFLWTQYDYVPALQTNATFADDWLAGMGEAAGKNEVAIQYCMPYPRDYLASVHSKQVRTIRASDDYHPNDGLNWRIGKQSLVAWAVGLLPFKDTFLSNSEEAQQFAADQGPELSADLHVLTSILSAGLVAPGDGPGYLNQTRLLGTCRADGRLLKPDRPMYPVDGAWSLERDPGGELVWTEVSLAPGALASGAEAFEFRYVLAAGIQREYDVSIEEIGLELAGSSSHSPKQYIARNWFSQEIRQLDRSSPLHLKAASASGRTGTAAAVDIEYWVVSEVLASGWAFLGEVEKYITVCRERATSIQEAQDDSLEVNLVGAPGEQVTMCALDIRTGASPGQLVCVSTAIGADGAASLVLTRVEVLFA